MFDQFINWNALKFGWPLVLVPLLIHLFNRLRHKRMPWAAMMFLRVASRKSTRYAKLRQFLILLTRMAAVLALIMALSRPLAGSWLGGMLSGKPETVLFVLDRSVTMESRDGARLSKREAAVRLLEQTAKSFPGIELWYLDPVVGTPQRVDRLQMEQSGLAAQFEINATDVPTDVPRLLETAAEWLKKNKSGNCDIWLASDMQQSNWHPDAAGRWAAVSQGLAGKELPFKARLQVLAKTQSVSNNFAVRVQEARQREVRNDKRLELVLKFTGPADATRPMPLKFHLNGKDVAENEVDAEHRQFNLSAATTKRQGQDAELVQNVFLPLAGAPATGWGYVQIGIDLSEDGERFATDDNPRDNRSYFVYGPGLEKARALVVGPAHPTAGYLRLAADPFDHNIARIVSQDALSEVKFEDYATVLWHGALPAGETGGRLQRYLAQGGVALFIPEANSTVASDRAFAGLSWRAAQAATNAAGQPLASWRQALPGIQGNATGKGEQQGGFLVGGWKDREGPLANAQNEKPLPVTDLITIRRSLLVDHGKRAVQHIEAARQIAEAVAKGETGAGIGNLMRDLLDALRKADQDAQALGTARWPADRAQAFAAELVAPLEAQDVLQESAATQAILRLAPRVKQWAAELEAAGSGHHLLAHYEDGVPLLSRQLVGRGQAYFLATRPDEGWSSLHEEWIFLILVQRLLEAGEALGAGSYSVAHSRLVGVFKPEAETAAVVWNAKVGEGEAPDYRRDAGIYESADGQVLALNRPVSEDDPRHYGPDQEHLLKGLMGEVPLYVHWENSSNEAGKAADGPKEIWRWFLVFMAAFLLGEAILILPRTSDETVVGREQVQPAAST